MSAGTEIFGLILQSNQVYFLTGLQMLESTACYYHRCIHRDLEASIPVWAPKLCPQKRFLVQYISRSIHIDK